MKARIAQFHFRPLHGIGPAAKGAWIMTAGLGRRARNIEEFFANFGALMEIPPDGYVPYQPEDGDVFITCWAKSGTTMMQQMFHQLRTGGDMDFDDITRMTPWEDSAVLIDYDMTTPQRAQPRGFKSHREYERLPAGMRYVVTLRDPKDTYASFHRFFSGWLFEPGSVSLEEFFPLWMLGGPGGCDYFTHLLSWYPRRDEPDTLLTTYRWAAKNRPAMIRRLADFLDIALTDDLASLVEERTRRDYMVAHEDKFDDRMFCEALNAKIGIPVDSDSAKVHAVPSDGKTIPQSVADQIDAMWAERVAPATGHRDFASLAAEVEART